MVNWEEFACVGSVSVVLTTSILQFFGFFTPYWACDILESGSSSCLVHGLFTFCPTADDCQSQVLTEDVLGLCATCFSLNCVIAPYLIWKVYKRMKKYGILEWELTTNGETTAIVLFIIGQFFAGIAAIIILNRYDVMGWSAVLFTTFGLPVFAVIVTILSVLVLVACCCVSKVKD